MPAQAPSQRAQIGIDVHVRAADSQRKRMEGFARVAAVRSGCVVEGRRARLSPGCGAVARIRCRRHRAGGTVAAWWRCVSSASWSCSTAPPWCGYRGRNRRCSLLSRRAWVSGCRWTRWWRRCGLRARRRRRVRRCRDTSPRLRRAVGAAAIVEVGGGYRLDSELVEVDATRVTGLVAAARESLRRGDADAAIGLFGEVNEAFRGEPYEGVPDTVVPAGEVQRLVELREAVVEDSAEAYLERGRGERCIGELEAVVQANPYRERAWGLLMRALYQAGRPADALAAFGRARVLLAAELGIEPGPALRDVEQAILTHDPLLAPTAAASARPGRSNLPAAAEPDCRPATRVRRAHTVAAVRAAGHPHRCGRDRQNPPRHRPRHSGAP